MIKQQTLFKDIYGGLSEKWRDSFIQYHRDNPQVYKAIISKTFNLINSGRTHGEMNYVFGWIRHETPIGGNDGFKLNNSYRSFYTRLFQSDYPMYKNFYKTRQKQSA